MPLHVLYGSFSFLLIVFCSCSKDSTCVLKKEDSINKTIALSAFNSISMRDFLSVQLLHDTIEKAEIIAPENILQHVSLDVSNQKLSIKNLSKCDWSRNYKNVVQITLHYINLDSIFFESSGVLTSLDTLKTSDLTIACTHAGGSISLLLNTQNTYVSINTGTVDVNLSGKTKTAYYYTGDAVGVIKAADLWANEVYCTNNGTGDFQVFSNHLLDAKINRSGSVYYKGNPTEIKTEIKGKGKVLSW